MMTVPAFRVSPELVLGRRAVAQWGLAVFLTMRISRPFKWLLGIGTLLVLAATFAIWPFRFSSYSVCSQCGAIQHKTEWQLPQIPGTFFTASAITQTVLSDYLTSSGDAGVHSHQWLFGHGGGNGIRCALGVGDVIRATVSAPEVPRLLAWNREFGHQTKSADLLRFTLDPEMSRTVLLLAAAVSTNGFANAETYRVWFEEQRWRIDDALEMAKQVR